MQAMKTKEALQKRKMKSKGMVTGPPNWNDEVDSPVIKKGETLTLLEQNQKEREEAARLASFDSSVNLPPVSLPRTGQHFALSKMYAPCSEAILYLREVFEKEAYSDLASSMETADDGRDEFILASLNFAKKTPEERKDDTLDKTGIEFMLRFPLEYFENACMSSMDRMLVRLKSSKEIAFVLDPLTRKVLERVLFRAFQNREIEIVKKILQWDINIDSADLFGTPLMYAASWGNAEHVRLLLERGAFVSSTNLHGTSSAHKGAEYGFDDVLRELISFGADVNCKDVVSTRPIHCAVHGDHADAAALLIAAGADINAVDGAGFSPLHISVAKKHLKTVCLLVQHPSLNLNLRSPSGRTALHFAAEIGEEFEHIYIMEKLLEGSSDVNAQDKNKRTALHCAMAMPHYKMASILVLGGASVMIPDNRGSTVAELIAFVPGENGLRKGIHEAKRREIAGEVYDKDAVSFGGGDEAGAAGGGVEQQTTKRRSYKEVADSEARYVEMTKEQDDVLAAYKKDMARTRALFKEKLHDAELKIRGDRPTSASTHSSQGSGERKAFDDEQANFEEHVMKGLVFCSNCERQLPSVVNIPEELRPSFFSFCSHCGFKGPCPDLVEALQSLNSLKSQTVSTKIPCFFHQQFHPFPQELPKLKFGARIGLPTMSSATSEATDTEFVYSLDATFCPECERQLPFESEMPKIQRESAFHFCPHCRHPNPSDGRMNVDSQFKTPRMYAPATPEQLRPSSALFTDRSEGSFHFKDHALFCQFCEYMLAVTIDVPPNDRDSAYNYCPHCGSTDPVMM